MRKEILDIWIMYACILAALLYACMHWVVSTYVQGGPRDWDEANLFVPAGQPAGGSWNARHRYLDPYPWLISLTRPLPPQRCMDVLHHQHAEGGSGHSDPAELL